MTDLTVKLRDGSYITITEVEGGVAGFAHKWAAALLTAGVVRTPEVALNPNEIVYAVRA